MLYRWLTLLFLLTVTTMSAQNLKEHRWENRLLLLVADSPQNKYLQSQLAILSQDTRGCKERKLAMYQVLPGRFSFSTFPLSTNLKWRESATLYKEYSKNKNTFTIYLIGLDVGIKQLSHKPWSLAEIYSFIDAMPMRQSEKRNTD